MSFEVRLDTAARSLHGVFRGAMFVFALASSALALFAGEPSQRGWIALACAIPFVVVLAAGTARPAAGRLTIDSSGRAFFLDAAHAAAGERAVRIERWNVFGPFAWLRLRAEGGRRPIEVLFVRGAPAARFGAERDLCAHADDAWRRLGAWLAWYRRGRAEIAASGDDPRPKASVRARPDGQ